MKKVYIIAITVAIETISLWLVSLFLGWNFIDTLLLGGLAIFGCVWMFKLHTNQTNNEFNAGTKGWTGQETGVIKPFQFKISSISLGLLIFVAVSFLITSIKYYSYFIN